MSQIPQSVAGFIGPTSTPLTQVGMLSGFPVYAATMISGEMPTYYLVYETRGALSPMGEPVISGVQASSIGALTQYAEILKTRALAVPPPINEMVEPAIREPIPGTTQIPTPGSIADVVPAVSQTVEGIGGLIPILGLIIGLAGLMRR